MKKKLFLIFFVLICFMSVFCKTTYVFADVGPKPSVSINFSGLDNKTYYVTLLSKSQTISPMSILLEGNFNENPDITEKFQSYIDTDGYYFLNNYKHCENNSSFVWSHPPIEFKILIYFPEEDLFCVSKSYNKNAFNSYYKVDMSNGMVVTDDNSIMNFKKIFNFIIRVVLTLIIEIGLAFLFKYSSKWHLKIIAITNVITQVLLNVAINMMYQFCGVVAVFFLLILLEIFIFIIESYVYAIYFNKNNIDQFGIVKKSVLYAFIANLLSFILGIVIFVVIPGMY